NNTTYYDGAYVISSKASGATLLTADDALYEKASREIPTLHLKDYKK
ncbi:PIN domain nuclease, partial [Candidatus Bathyarchaeota archaeon]|nr:PIN domain nuclease [Candidatus Bathyarchaeota archaeon]